MVWERIKIGSRVKSGWNNNIGKVIEIYNGGPGGVEEASTGTFFVIEWESGETSHEFHLNFEDMGLGNKIELIEEKEMKEIRGAEYANLALDVVKNIKNEIGRLNRGPASFYFEKMGTYVRALFERFAPFKGGDRVRLIDDIPMTDSNPGWHYCAHFLKKGEMATVEYVDYDDRYGQGRFIADCIFDNETFKDENGELHPVKNNHLFSISEKWLEKVEEDKCPE